MLAGNKTDRLTAHHPIPSGTGRFDIALPAPLSSSGTSTFLFLTGLEQLEQEKFSFLRLRAQFVTLQGLRKRDSRPTGTCDLDG